MIGSSPARFRLLMIPSIIEKLGYVVTVAVLLNHHFIKLGFLDAWKKVVPGRETEMFLRLRKRLAIAA